MTSLLDYIDGKEPEDDCTRELDGAVNEVRDNEKWRLEYMTLQMSYQEKFEQGRELGLEQGRELGLNQKLMDLIQKKLSKGKDISQIADELEEDEETIRAFIHNMDK